MSADLQTIFFIKGPVSKLHTKISAFYEHLHGKVQDFSKELSSPNSVLGKMPVRIKSLHWFCRALYFQRKMFNKFALDGIWLCVPVFERFLHHKINLGIRCEHYSFQKWVHWCCTLRKNRVWYTEIGFFMSICLSKYAACLIKIHKN